MLHSLMAPLILKTDVFTIREICKCGNFKWKTKQVFRKSVLKNLKVENCAKSELIAIFVHFKTFVFHKKITVRKKQESQRKDN